MATKKPAVKTKAASVAGKAAGKAVKSEAKKQKGRPTVFTPALADRICELIAEGRPNREICKMVGIAEKSLYNWLSNNPGFVQQYATSKERQADFYAQQIVGISDEATVEVRHQGEDVVLDISSSAVARNRLRIDARKWIASKLAPKKYGEKLQVGGAEDLPPIKSEGTLTLSADEAYKRMLSGGPG